MLQIIHACCCDRSEPTRYAQHVTQKSRQASAAAGRTSLDQATCTAIPARMLAAAARLCLRNLQRVMSAGEWCIEYLPFFSASQVQAAQARVGCPALPLGTDLQQELFRGVHRQHAKVAMVTGRKWWWFVLLYC